MRGDLPKRNAKGDSTSPVKGPGARNKLRITPDQQNGEAKQSAATPVAIWPTKL